MAMFSPERPRGDDSFLSDSSLPAGNEAVLLRCRDTIRRLHAEVEDERCKRHELQQELHAAQADVRHLQAELDRERERAAESDVSQTAAKAARRDVLRLEERLAESERAVSMADKKQASLLDQLHQAKAEVAQRAEAQISAEVKVTELENALRRAENRALSLEEEAASCSSRLAASAGKVADMEREVTALRSAADLESERTQHANRLMEEYRRRSELAQQDLDAAQAASHIAARSAQEAQEDLLRVQDELTKLQHECAQQQRDKEMALTSAATASARSQEVDTTLDNTRAALEKSSLECKALQRRVADLEQRCKRAEQRAETAAVEALQQRVAEHAESFRRAEQHAEAKVVEASVATVTSELEEVREQLRSKDLELATALAEGDAVRQQVKRMLDRHNELEGRCHDVETERDACQQLLAKSRQQFDIEASELVERLKAQWQIERQTLLENSAQAAAENAAKSAALLADERSNMERHNLELQEELRKYQKQDRGVSAQLRWQQADLQRRLEAVTSEFRAEQRCGREAKAAVQELQEALRSSDGELDAYEEVVEKLRQSYERKLAKLHRQLVERETYESRLKSLIDKEVDVLHHYNQDLADFPRAHHMGWNAGEWRA